MSDYERFGITVGAQCELPGVQDSEEAYRRADEIRTKVARVLAQYGVSKREPLVNVWDSGDYPVPSDEEAS
jgi:hypothetical protein